MKSILLLVLISFSAVFLSACVTVAPPMHPAKRFSFRPMYRPAYRYAVPFRPMFRSHGCHRR
jgi:hypothetical protein